MEQLHTSFDLVFNAVQTAFQNGDWDKFAAWGVYVVAFLYGAFYGIKKGTYTAGYVLGASWALTAKAYNRLFPLPEPPPEPSDLCHYIVEALRYEDMLYDEKTGELVCGPVSVKLLVDSTTVQNILVGGDTPIPHLTELDRDRVFQAVKSLVETYYRLRAKDTVHRMVSSVQKHLHSTTVPMPAPLMTPLANAELHLNPKKLPAFNGKRS